MNAIPVLLSFLSEKKLLGANRKVDELKIDLQFHLETSENFPDGSKSLVDTLENVKTILFSKGHLIELRDERK